MSAPYPHPRLARAALAWAGLAALAAALASPPPAPAQKFKSDPAEALRALFQAREAASLPTDEKGDALKKKVKEAADHYRADLDRAVAKLTNPAEMVAAILLVDTQTDNGWSRPTLSTLPEPFKKVVTDVFGNPRALKEARYREFVALMPAYYAKEKDLTESFEAQARAAEVAARKRLTDALAKTLRSGPAKHRAALCQLLREAMAGAWLTGGATDAVTPFDELADALTGPLTAAATEREGDTRMRAAACRALARFHLFADKAAEALQKSLAPDAPEAVRLAAADSLEEMIQSAIAPERLRRSEPGVSITDAKSVTPKLPDDLKDEVAAAVALAAYAGSADTSELVRRQCALALQWSAAHLNSILAEQGVDPSGVKAGKKPPDRKARPLGERGPLLKALSGTGGHLRRALLDSDAEVRQHARSTLTLLAKVINGLSTASREGKDRGLREGLKGLTETVKRAVQDVIESGFDDPSAASRRAAAEAGEALVVAAASNAAAAEGSRRARREEADRAARRLASAPDEKARKERQKEKDDADEDARSAEERFKEADARAEELAALIGPRLARGLKDRDPFVRWIVARAIGKMVRRPEEMVPALAENFADDDLDARKAAIMAAGQYGAAGGAAAPALARVLGKGDADVRLAVLEALEAIGLGSAPALPAVVGEFGHPNPRVRAAAATLVGRFEAGARPHLEALRKLADDPDPDVRRAASAAILAIPSE